MPYPYTIHLQTESGGDAGKVSITLDDTAIDYITSFPYGGIDAVIHEVSIRLAMAKPEMIYRLLAIKKGEDDEATKRAKAYWEEYEAERAACRGTLSSDTKDNRKRPQKRKLASDGEPGIF